MNPAQRRNLQLPALALLLALLAASGAVYYTGAVREQARQALRQEEAQLREASTRLHRSGDERETIVRYLARYQELQRIGFAGDEQRISWLDGLRHANERLDLFGIDYRIAAQTPYAHAKELNPGEVVLQQSVMTARLRLLHEEDLLRFLRALRAADAGLFAVDECALQRLESGADIRYQPQLAAECKLSWITAKARRMETPP